jgi:hypothetical protein
MRSVPLTALLLIGLFAWDPTPSCAGAEPAGEDLFTTRVRPILARHCLKCHGQDDKARKAKLRLDIRSEAIKPAGSGFAPIVPGKPDESELIGRIFSEEPDEVMPPPQAKNPLSDADKAVLKRWVAEGAEYRTHWAYIPPRKVPLPKVEHQDWPRNEIDPFILARLEAEGLEPSPEADRYTLIRRLSLDLLGLPPTPEQVDQFLRDGSADAYENLVDRLLASPHYGERWARRWLDLARYADTNGYEKDRPRSIWPYRDWVIQALNDDLPFDQFTIAQLAGDMLPGRTADQRIATGFHRNTMLNEEGGIDPLEFRYHAMTDRVATTGTVWLGLTIGCAQCHTHKFDPIPHREYYQFMALLNNADEPEMQVPSAEIARKRAELEAKIAALVADLPNRFPTDACPDDARPVEARRKEAVERAFHKWLAGETAASVRWEELTPVEAKANLPLLTIQDDGSVFASGDQSKRDVYTLRFRTGLRGVSALRLEVLPDPRLPSQGPGRVYYEGPAGDFFLSEFSVLANGKRLPVRQATASFPKAKAAEAAIDGDPQTGWRINGGQGREHSAVFRLAEPLEEAGNFDVELLFERYHAAGLGRFRILATTAPDPAPARETPRALERLLLIPECERTAEQTRQLFEHFLLVAPELAKPREAIDKLRAQLPRYPTTLVMEERPADNPRPTFVHNRGEFLQPKERVEPAVPSVLPPLPKDAPRNRLALARWLVSRENPLTARVTMNRQWAALFGQGLVRTTEDFGYQGDPPTHPELLDWLAVEFAERGWSLKRMHKLIVMSATYRQSSRVAPKALAKDPDNRLLSHAPRVRLDAEVIRDQALRVSGLFSERVGGPSVFPPQPPGVTTEGAYGRLDWKVSDGGDRYRRGLYTFSKRTAPYAMFITFDAPSGEVCVAKREVSNTPLQALTLLNDPVFEEAAQALGRRMAAECGSVAERVEALFRRCLTRPPLDDERDALVRFYRAQKARLDRKELDAGRIAGKSKGEDNAAERAAWTLLARVLLNLDETVTKG